MSSPSPSIVDRSCSSHNTEPTLGDGCLLYGPSPANAHPLGYNDRSKGMTQEIFKMFVYEVIVVKFVRSHLLKTFQVDRLQEVFLDFQAELF